MSGYNPSSPTKLGPEWMPTLEQGIPINEFQHGAAHFTPSGAVTGDDLVFVVDSLIGTPHLQLDIIPAASAVPGTVTTTSYAPNGDDSQSGVLTHAAGGTSAPFYVDVDEVGAIDANYLKLSSNAGAARFQFGTVAASGRPLAVTVRAVVEAVVGFTNASLVPTLEVGGVAYAGDTTEISGLGQHTVEHTWDHNPATGGAWTIADIQALDGTDSAGFTYVLGATNSLWVHQLVVDVDTVAEARVAIGVAAPTADGRVTVSMTTPAGADTWALTSGTKYLLIVTCPSGDGRIVWPTINSIAVDGDDLVPVAHPANIGSNAVTLDVNGIPSAIGDDDTAAPAFVVLTTTGPSTADVSQPYPTVDEEAVYSGRTIEQEFTPPGAASYGHVSFVCRQQSDDTSEPLTVQVGRRDTGAILGTGTVTPFDVRDTPRLQQVVRINLAAAASLPASQCFVRWSSTADAGDGWLVTTLDTDDSAVEKLTTQQQGLEDGTATGWVADTGGAIAASGTQKRTGSWALRLVWNTVGGGTAKADTLNGTSGFPVIGLARYTATGYVRSTTSGRASRMKLRWFDAAGTTISTSAAGSDVSGLSTGFTQVTVTAVAPSTAVYGAIVIESDVTSSTDYQYWDDFSVQGPLLGLAVAGYGGATDIPTIAGVDNPFVDIPVLVSKVPATIAGVTATELAA